MYQYFGSVSVGSAGGVGSMGGIFIEIVNLYDMKTAISCINIKIAASFLDIASQAISNEKGDQEVWYV